MISLYMKKANTDFNTALSDLARDLNIDIDESPAPGRTETPQGAFTEPAGEYVKNDIKTAENGNQSPEEKDFTQYYRKCREQLREPAALAYLNSRGISLDTAEAFGIGYDTEARRIIIPNGKGHYNARSIDPNNPLRYKSPKGAAAGLFNSEALYKDDVQEVFVTEGAFDALSFIEVGAEALALNSTSNIKKLLNQLEEKKTEATLIVCLDKDEAGSKAAAELRAGLDRLNISYIYPEPAEYLPTGCKDANEALTATRSRFADDVERIIKNHAKPDSVIHYIEKFMLADMDNFKHEKKTGFSLLDYKAGGGLYPGLYAIGAISSLGKTTITHQIADQLAEQGHDVIFFSLEQSRLEMVSKSLARRIRQSGSDKEVTSLQIRKQEAPAEEVSRALEEYTKAVGDRLTIIEGNFSCDAGYISRYTRNYIQRNKVRPVVIVDYLQILQPGENDRRQGMREAVDSTVTELKRLSRELDITVIVISSVNRANYLTPFDFESLKESGGIEYTADVVWGLQLQALNEDIFNSAAGTKTKEKRERVKQAKAETPRKIELVCLKNRYGQSSFSCYFDYFPKYDLFVERDKDSGQGEEKKPVKRTRF